MERTAAAADDLWILDAEVVRNGGTLTISLSCSTNQASFRIEVVAGDFSVDGADGYPQGLDAVSALAERYWDSDAGVPNGIRTREGAGLVTCRWRTLCR
jgi:hypothetical protein